jgi:non-specific serine/threonine protein kinase
VETAQRLGGALGWFWVRRGHLEEGEQWLEQILSPCHPAQTSSLASTLESAATVAWARWRVEDALTRAREALTLYRNLGNQVGIARALSMIGIVEQNRDGHEAAIAAFEEALEVQSTLRDENGIAYSLLHLGYVTIDQRNYPRATELLQHALLRFRRVTDEQGILLALIGLADAEIPLHHYAAAAAGLRESLQLCERAGDKLRMVDCFEGMAFLAASRRQGARAAHLLGAASTLREAIAAVPSVVGAAYGQRVEELARAAIGDQAYAEHLASGCRMSTDEAIDIALEVDRSTTASRTHSEDLAHILTPRERRVVRLVAEGLSNREIATELVVTERTAEAHVSNALNKLGLKSRTQLAVRIARSTADNDGSR